MPTLFALGWAAVSPFMAGCQSGAQQDLVARELRLQEDKIYAMEDYLTQYQQLVCKYRSENSALRRRLAEGYYDGDDLPEPKKAPRAGDERTTRPGGTSIEIRETPGAEGEQPPSREIEIDLPDVPPLEGSTSNEADSTQVVTAAHYEAPALDRGEAASAAGKPRGKSSGKASAQAIIDPSRSTESQDEKHQQPAPDSKAPLRLHGEVVANNLGAGPRLVVNIESTDETQTDAEFSGDVSLMLLVNHGADGDEKLARWDFGREDVRAAKEAASKPGAMQFHLELPADTPIAESTELWLRLVGHDASKLLAHADVDLAQPGLFASAEQAAPQTASAATPTIAAVERHETSIPARIAASLVEGEWSIARPGEPANLPTPEDLLTGGWRMSSEPTAVVAQSNAVAAPARPFVQQAIHVEDLSEIKPTRTYKPPTWSPDRPNKVATQSDDSATKEAALSRPAWSATR